MLTVSQSPVKMAPHQTKGKTMGAQTWNDVKEDVGAACVGAGVVLLAAFAAYLIW